MGFIGWLMPPSEIGWPSLSSTGIGTNTGFEKNLGTWLLRSKRDLKPLPRWIPESQRRYISGAWKPWWDAHDCDGMPGHGKCQWYQRSGEGRNRGYTTMSFPASILIWVHIFDPIQKKRVIYRISKLHNSQDPRIWHSFRLAVEVVIGHVPRVEPQRLWIADCRFHILPHWWLSLVFSY